MINQEHPTPRWSVLAPKLRGLWVLLALPFFVAFSLTIFAASPEPAVQNTSSQAPGQTLTNVVAGSMMMTAAGFYFIGTADAQNVDISLDKQRKEESNARFDFNSHEGISSRGALLINRTGTWKFTGRIGLAVKAKSTSSGFTPDPSATIIYMPFNKGHSLSVTMDAGAVSQLRQKRVRATTSTRFVLKDGDDSEFNARIKDRSLEVLPEGNAQKKAPASILLPEQDGSYVYPLVDGLPLQSSSALTSIAGVQVSFGQRFTVLETKGNWLRVQTDGENVAGWLHRAQVTYSESDLMTMRRLGLRPTCLTFVFDVKATNSFSQTALGGTVKLQGSRLAADQLYSVVFAEEEALSRCAEIAPHVLIPSGIAYTLPPISRPKPWTLYFFSVAHNRFTTLADLLAQQASALLRTSSLATTAEAVSPHSGLPPNWPKASSELSIGPNPVRIKNPNEFGVMVALRLAGRGKDFPVQAGTTETVHVPNGSYDIYFQYSTDPLSLYQGDSFTLNNNGVEIQIVKVVGGNYGIRKVK